MQHHRVWLAGAAPEPGPRDAKCASEPGSVDTAKMGVSSGPGSPHAKTLSLLHQNRDERCSQEANQSISLHILPACKRATNHGEVACTEPGSVEPGA